MKAYLKVYIDRLRDGHIELIDETISSDILDVQEKDLSFSGQITISGRVYLTDDHLILQANLSSQAVVPCAICNQPVSVPIRVENFYFAKPIEELPAVFDYSDEIREAILLHAPAFAECSNGNCPERKVVNKFLKQSDQSPDETVNFPFADLDK